MNVLNDILDGVREDVAQRMQRGTNFVAAQHSVRRGNCFCATQVHEAMQHLARP